MNSPKRIRKCGYAYRIKALEKQEKEKQLVQQIHKIDSFFIKNVPGPSCSTAVSNGLTAVEEEEEVQVRKLF